MNFRILKYFLTVVREKNITKAAEILHITQPTLSRQLMQLEEELDVKLFDRSQHKFALTPAGQFLVQRAQEILDMVEKTTLDIHEQEVNLSGSITFGAGELQTITILAKIIKAFQGKYPQVSFDLFTATSDIIRDKTEKGLIDIALLQEPIDTENYDYVRLQEKEVWGILMRSDAELAVKKFIIPKDLEAKPIVLPTRLQVRSEIFNWLSGDIAKMHFVGSCNLLGNTAALVQQNNYYAITIQTPLTENHAFAFRPLQPALTSNVVLAWRRGKQQSLALQKFIEFAKCFLSIE